MISFFKSKVGIYALSEEKTGSCFSYEEPLACGVFSAFRCRKRTVFPSLFAILQKGIFIMNKKLTVKKLSMLAMLTALTVILAIFCTFRIGNAIKIPFKFVTVFITAAVYGPIWGGVVGALGDILNSVLVPVGAPLPQITAVEFLYGVIFGLFFYGKFRKRYFFNTILCAFVLCVIDITIMSYILTSVGYFPTFAVAVATRFTATIVKFFMYIAVCLLLKKYLTFFERLINK